MPNRSTDEPTEGAQDLMGLVKTNPDEALRLARRGVHRDAASRTTAGSVIAQVGLNRRDHALLWEAVEVLRQSTLANPDRSGSWYNLGNALQGLSDIDGTKEPEHYLKTRELRREGRRAFTKAGRLRNPPEIATQALTNLGNWLSESGRWVEAYQAYQEALAADPGNGAAAGNLAILLRRRIRVSSHKQELSDLAAHYARLERAHRDTTLRYAGSDAAEVFDRLPIEGPSPGMPKPTNPYQRWVASEHLSLSLTIEDLAPGPRWDDLHIGSLWQPMDSSSAVPALFAMINVLKQDFLLARKLAFEALTSGQIPQADSSFYADTLDYALYGEQPATLTLAQRAAVDLLDRIAVTTNEYLEVCLRPEDVVFATFWAGPQRSTWRQPLQDELAAGNRSLLALADLAFDIDKGGYLSDYRELRNTGTHRFIVLHDMRGSSDRSPAVEHRQLDAFQEQLLATLRTTRAALLYLVSMIGGREHRLHHGPNKPSAPLPVLGHHEIRRRPA